MKFECIAVLAFLILDCYVLSLSARLNIQRGDGGDIFDNPNCNSSTGFGCVYCDNLNAFCIDSCKRCQCNMDHETFIYTNDNNGRCVKNHHLLFIPSYPNSFLVQRIGLACMKNSKNYYIWKTDCNPADSGQRWIWTRNNQLMHVDSLRCLQEGHYAFYSYSWSGKYYYYYILILEECNRTETKQLWQCQGQNNANFQLRDWLLYMYQDNSKSYIYGIDGIFHPERIKWQRWSSEESLCSKAFGCYEFVSSPIFFTDMTTLGESEISIPRQLGEKTCFVLWDNLQYLDKDDWEQLPFRDEIFTVERYNTQTYLKLNYAKATNNWTGLIVKLQFYCTRGQSTQVNATNTKCVVIKFKGSRIYPPTVPPAVFTTHGQPTTPSKTTTPSQPITPSHPITPSKTLTSAAAGKPSPLTSFKRVSTRKDTNPRTNSPTSSVVTMPNATAAANKSKRDSSPAPIVVVCVVITILILCGVLGFVFYKRRIRSAENKEVEQPDTKPSGASFNPIYSPVDDSPSPFYPESPDTEPSGATFNPIYSPADDSPSPFYPADEDIYQEPDTGASRECDLYEPGGDNIYDYIDVEQNG